MARVYLTALAGAALAAIMAMPDSARAQFGDCSDGDYLALFDERLQSTPFAYDCNERLRLTVMTDDGERAIRLIHDASADWAMVPGIVAEAERGLRAAAAALEQIGPFRMDPVTVLLIDGLPPRSPGGDGFSDIAAMTGHTPGGECRIGLWLLSAGGDPAHAAFALAHEFFHCVQLATLTPAQMATARGGTGSGGDWWIEGSAEWFAALAVADPGPLPERVETFNEISADVALYDMAYASVVFFLWLGEERGAAGILPFLRGMADNPSAAAQRAAMASAVSADDWLRFAQAYLDREIRHPHGTGLALEPSEGEDWAWDRTRTETIGLEPFVLKRGWLVFQCGRWGTDARPAAARHAVREEGGPWGGLPPQIEVEEGEPARFRFAAMAAARERIDLRIEGRVEASCEPCAGSRAIDRCLVGAWRQTGGGAVEWMRRNMPPGLSIPNVNAGEQAMVLMEDGTYWTAPFSQELTILIEGRDGTTRADGRGVAQASGRWSAEGGRLNLCADSEAFSGRAVFTPPSGGRFTMPLAAPGPSGPMSYDYTCSAGSLETRLGFSGIPDPMVTQFSAMTPAGE